MESKSSIAQQLKAATFRERHSLVLEELDTEQVHQILLFRVSVQSYDLEGRTIAFMFLQLF